MLLRLTVEIFILLIGCLMAMSAKGQFKITTDLRGRAAVNGIHVIVDGNAAFMDGHSGTYVFNDTLSIDDGYTYLRTTALPVGGWVKLKTNINSTSDLYDTLNTRLRTAALTGALIAATLGYTPANASSVTNYTQGTGISISSGVISNTSPGQTVALTGANGFSATGTYPNFTLTQYIPTASIVTRTINSSTYTISTTKQAYVNYNVTISCTATIGSAATGSVALQYSTNAGSTWTTVGTVSNSNTVTLAVTLNSVQISGLQLSGYIPANALVRLVPATAGTTTITYLTGQETF